MHLVTSIEIDAPAHVVWQILTDFERYPAWNPFTVRVEGTPAVGEVVVLHVDLGGELQVRKHQVSRVEPDAALCWIIRSRRPWLLRGERCQTIEPIGPDRCRYANDEQAYGLYAQIGRLAGFERRVHHGLIALGAALKARAEAATLSDEALAPPR